MRKPHQDKGGKNKVAPRQADSDIIYGEAYVEGSILDMGTQEEIIKKVVHGTRIRMSGLVRDGRMPGNI